MNRGTVFFCMLGLYKRQSRAEARGRTGGNRRRNREKNTSTGEEKNKTQKTKRPRETENQPRKAGHTKHNPKKKIQRRTKTQNRDEKTRGKQGQ
jgi:hypothetical protein